MRLDCVDPLVDNFCGIEKWMRCLRWRGWLRGDEGADGAAEEGRDRGEGEERVLEMKLLLGEGEAGGAAGV